MATSRTDAQRYWSASRSHRYSLLFALPLLVAYELLEAVAPVRSGGGVIRNGADVVLTDLFIWILGPRGPLVFMGLVIGVSLWLIRRDRASGPLRPGFFALMFGESVLLAMVFGLVVGVATVHILGPLHAMAAPAAVPGTLAKLTLSLGAGLYEELLFRVVLVSLLANLMRIVGLSRLFAGAFATLIGALVFSAFHYVGSLGEPFRVESFVFRAVAGVMFSALYLTRGFGITAWTHALYDIAVLL
jgi:Type II CAAX prenyl endopeptidase Rce1-like